MKNFLWLFLVLLMFACKDINQSSDNKTDSKESFLSFDQVKFLEGYEKISDTSYAKSGYEPTHQVSEFKKDSKTLIVFSDIEFNAKGEERFSILDTLHIRNLKEDHIITIGYCEMEKVLMEEIIAIVKRTDKDTIGNIEKAWMANSHNRKIEPIKDLEMIFCLNEN